MLNVLDVNTDVYSPFTVIGNSLDSNSDNLEEVCLKRKDRRLKRLKDKLEISKHT